MLMGGHDSGIRLPAHRTSFVGRERELAAIHALLDHPDVQLVTLTGSGGVGKTRLAERIAAERIVAGNPDPVWISLAPLESVDQVAQAIGQAFGLRGSGVDSLPDRLAAALLGNPSLIVLDNFEHLSDTAPLVAELLMACPTLTMLATSRGPLFISWERVVPIDPLPLPSEDADPGELIASPAVQLFLERALSDAGEPEQSADELRAVSAICRRLDGLPLAIELAAPWRRILPASELLKRLDRRLPLLTTGPADAPPRLQTMRDAIGWSYALLSTNEQRLFRQLAIFPEGFTLDAAEFLSASVASEADDVVPADEGATLQGLAQLVHRGLVRAPEAHRFRQLQTIRDYGLELLIEQGELEQCRRAHLAWCLSRTAEPVFDPLDGYIWATLEQADDLADLTAALAFAFEQGETEHALRLAVGLSPIWAELGRYDEARGSLSRVVDDLPTASSRARAVITGWMAEWAWLQGDYAATTLLARTSLDSSRFLALSSGVAANLYRLGRVATLSHPPDGLPLLLDALALYRDLDDARGSFWSLLGLGYAALATGDVERARDWFAEAGDELVRVEESAGAWPTLGHALGLASLALATNDLFGAETMLVDALELSREHRNSYFECLALSLLCAVQRRNKTYVRAVESGRVGLQIAQRLGSPYRECQCLTQLARLALDAGKFDQAMLLQGASSELRDNLGVAGADIGLGERLAHESAGRLERLALFEQAGRELSGSERLAQVMALELDLRQISEHTGALSVREREVLVLLSQGATNGTIADQLFVSRRTVETHVGSILRKLHVTTRVEAGRAARERGLLAADEG